GPALLFAFNPIWLFTDARRLLRAGAAQPPVGYDVGRGLERHQQLANASPLASQPPPIAELGAAAHASLGSGIVGLGAAGVATIGVLAMVALLRPVPVPFDEGKAVAMASAPPSLAPPPPATERVEAPVQPAPPPGAPSTKPELEPPAREPAPSMVSP